MLLLLEQVVYIDFAIFSKRLQEKSNIAKLATKIMLHYFVYVCVHGEHWQFVSFVTLHLQLRKSKTTYILKLTLNQIHVHVCIISN